MDPTDVAQLRASVTELEDALRLLAKHVATIAAPGLSRRHRINVSSTTKGGKSFDCTVDIEGATMEDVLAESDRLVEALNQRYQPQAKEVIVIDG